MDALKFLKTDLAETVDHQNAAESASFRRLTANLFEAPNAASTMQMDSFTLRTELYEQLIKFFPDEMKQPKGNLVDMLN